MNTEMNLKKLPVDLLKPAKYNPRKGPQTQAIPPMKKSSEACTTSVMWTP